MHAYNVRDGKCYEEEKLVERDKEWQLDKYHFIKGVFMPFDIFPLISFIIFIDLSFSTFVVLVLKLSPFKIIFSGVVNKNHIDFWMLILYLTYFCVCLLN